MLPTCSSSAYYCLIQTVCFLMIMNVCVSVIPVITTWPNTSVTRDIYTASVFNVGKEMSVQELCCAVLLNRTQNVFKPLFLHFTSELFLCRHYCTSPFFSSRIMSNQSHTGQEESNPSSRNVSMIIKADRFNPTTR